MAARLRGAAPVAFIRADAPLREGGAGQSLLIESHRSVLCPCWGICTLLLEPTLSEAFLSRKLPKWRELTIDEILQSQSQEFLKLDRVEMGPRYHVWSFQAPNEGSALDIVRQSSDWTGLWDPVREPPSPDHLAEALDSCMGKNASAVLFPVSTRERPLYVVASKSSKSSGAIVLWDLRHRCKWQHFHMTAADLPREGPLRPRRFAHVQGRDLRVTALGPGPDFHFAAAGQSDDGLRFQLFDGAKLVQQACIDETKKS